MTDKTLPQIAVKLDKERHFLVSMGALRRFQKASGKNILDKTTMDQISTDLKSNTLTDDLFILLCACLRHEDDKLTVEQLEDMICPGTMQEVLKKFFEAWAAAMPDKKSEENEEADPLANPPAG
jgi:hypothetical protein